MQQWMLARMVAENCQQRLHRDASPPDSVGYALARHKCSLKVTSAVCMLGYLPSAWGCSFMLHLQLQRTCVEFAGTVQYADLDEVSHTRVILPHLQAYGQARHTGLWVLDTMVWSIGHQMLLLLLLPLLKAWLCQASK
jgi:hypothetical protein